MRVVRLEGSRISTKAEFLDAVADALAFPDYFGRNWDALDDCLSDITEPTTVEWVDADQLAAADAAAYEMAIRCFAETTAPVTLEVITRRSVGDDGEFRFPPALNPQTFGELKYITMWELWAEPPIWEIFSDALHLDRVDPEACAERVIRELLEEGYAAVVSRPWGVSEATPEFLAPAEVDRAITQLRDFDIWRNHEKLVQLTPTAKWDEWARINKGTEPDPAIEDIWAKLQARRSEQGGATKPGEGSSSGEPS